MCLKSEDLTKYSSALNITVLYSYVIITGNFAVIASVKIVLVNYTDFLRPPDPQRPSQGQPLMDILLLNFFPMPSAS